MNYSKTFQKRRSRFKKESTKTSKNIKHVLLDHFVQFENSSCQFQGGDQIATLVTSRRTKGDDYTGGIRPSLGFCRAKKDDSKESSE